MASVFKLNVGSTDRVVRIVLGVVLIGSAFAFRNSLGNIGLGVGVTVGLVLIGTAALRFCPAYLPFGLSTCRTKS